MPSAIPDSSYNSNNNSAVSGANSNGHSADSVHYQLSLTHSPASMSELIEVVELGPDYRLVRALIDLPAGTVIGPFDGTIKSLPDRYTVCIGDGVHVLNCTPVVLINHSCSPNTGLQWPHAILNGLTDGGNGESGDSFPVIVTLRNVSRGEELTWNYNSSEWELASPFDCSCKSVECVGTVRGSKHLSPLQRQSLAGLLAPHIEKFIADEIVLSKPPNRLRVCVLTSSYDNGKDVLKDVDNFVCNPAYVNQSHDFTYHSLSKDNCYSETRKLIKSGEYDVFFNLCDGALDGTTAGIDVIKALETYDAAFTGADSEHYEPTKIDMKVLATYAGINVPPYFHLKSLGDLPILEQLFDDAGLTFPVIIKHVSGYSSIGMTRDSRCDTFEQLRKQSSIFVTNFGEALIENFIEGEEVTVLAYEGNSVLENPSSVEVKKNLARKRFVSYGPTDDPNCNTMAPIKMRFPANESFKHFDLKWISHDDMKWERVGKPNLDRDCRDVGLRAFKAILKGIGYGRTDLRVDKNGKVWFLEINPNCGIFYPPGMEGSADFIMLLDKSVGGSQFVNLMVNAAQQRKVVRQLSRPCFDTVFSAKTGDHYLRANREIEIDELVFADEGKAFNLVTLSHVEANWSEEDKLTFRRYAWPISKDIFAIWSPDHQVWRPINHSCDPNCWFGANNSLHVYARRKIANGEGITMDYSTFCSSDQFESFNCSCGASNCRKVIVGKAFPHIAQTYGSRVTPFVGNSV